MLGKEILNKRKESKALYEAGYDGLVNSDKECECDLSNFKHCGDDQIIGCVPGKFEPGQTGLVAHEEK